MKPNLYGRRIAGTGLELSRRGPHDAKRRSRSINSWSRCNSAATVTRS